MRSSIGGWVAKRSAKPERGLSTHISMRPDGTPSSSPLPEIFIKAEIIASGFLVSSTEPASARYSRERDSAKRITSESAQASAISASAIRIATKAPPPPLLFESELLDERDDDEPLQRGSTSSQRKTSSPKNEITPAMTTAVTIMRTSSLRMCV